MDFPGDRVSTHQKVQQEVGQGGADHGQVGRGQVEDEGAALSTFSPPSPRHQQQQQVAKETAHERRGPNQQQRVAERLAQRPSLEVVHVSFIGTQACTIFPGMNHYSRGTMEAGVENYSCTATDRATDRHTYPIQTAS